MALILLQAPATLNQRVAGSSPATPTNKINTLSHFVSAVCDVTCSDMVAFVLNGLRLVPMGPSIHGQ
jgi:hypothetical protein